MAVYTQEQQEAINSTCRLIALQAGPGTGKTTTLVARVAKQLEECDPSQVVVLTFTRKAAREMTERLAKKTSKKPAYIGTFHGYANQAIQTYGEWLGYKPGPVAVLTEKEEKELRDRTATRLGVANWPKSDPRDKEQMIKNAMLTECRNSNIITYDLMQEEALRLLVMGALPQITYLFVDEYQDTDEVQHKFVMTIAGSGANVFAVGDENQSIYEWRNARPECFRSLADHGFHWMMLSENFRCHPYVIVKANALVSEDTRQKIGDIDVTDFDEVKKMAGEVFEARVGFSVYKNEKEESERICIFAKDAIEMNFTLGVLCRSNATLERISGALTAEGIEHSAGRQTEQAIDEPLATKCRVVMNPENDYVFEQFLRNGDWSERNITKAKQLSHSKCLSLFRHFLLEHEPFDLFDWTPETEVHEGMTVRQVVETLESNRMEEQVDNALVRVMTIHGAKGLEFDNVAVPEMVERKKNGNDEERRLVYVATTRAKKAVLFTYPETIINPYTGIPEPQEPSRFLSQMGVVEWSE